VNHHWRIRTVLLTLIACCLGAVPGCGLILGVGNERLVEFDGASMVPEAAAGDDRTPTISTDDAEDPRPDAEIGALDADEAGAEAEIAALPVQAVYAGGRILTQPTSLVAVYWGHWASDAESRSETDLEPFFGEIVQTSYFAAITQYYGMVDGGRKFIAPPSLQLDGTRYFHDPQMGGIGDPDAFIENIVTLGGDPGAIYVVFFPPEIDLCASRDGCSGLTANAHVPFVRIQYGDDYLASSRAAFRELVDVMTDSDGEGWTVPFRGQNYPIGQICSKALGGGGLGSTATIRLWSGAAIYGSDGVFSALSDHGHGACISSLVTQGVLAAVDDAGGVTAYPLAGSPVPVDGVRVTGLAHTNNVTVAAGPLGPAWDGFWTSVPDGGGTLTQAWPEANDLTSQAWGSSSTPAPLPSGYERVSSMDVAMQGEARWDGFAVGFAAGDASAPSAQLFHYYWDNYLDPTSNGWQAFGDGTSAPGITGIVSGPGVTSFAPGRVDAFVLGAGADGRHLLHTWCDDRTKGVHIFGSNCDSPLGWADLGMPPDGVQLVGDPDAASWPSSGSDGGHFAVVCSATDGTLRYLQSDDGIASWSVLSPPSGHTFLPSPTIATMGDHRYLVAGQTTDGALWQWLYDWGPGGWTPSGLAVGAVAIDMMSY
jgi:hypothetical protein